jgi:hypothetical protein
MAQTTGSREADIFAEVLKYILAPMFGGEYGPEKEIEFFPKFRQMIDIATHSPQQRAWMIESLLEVIEEHPKNLAAQYRVIAGPLSSLVAINQKEEIPARERVKRAVFRAMENYEDEADIQCFGCAILGACLERGWQRSDTQGMQRAMSAILRAINMHEGDERTQDMGMKALMCTSGPTERDTEASINMLVSLGAVRAIIRSMKLFPRNTTIQGKACVLLWGMARFGHIEKLWSEQAMAAVLRALSYFCKEKDTIDVHLTRDEACLDAYNVIHAMYNGCAAPLHRQAATPQISVLLDAMATCKDSSKLVAKALRTIQAATAGHNHNAQALRGEKSLKMIVNSMRAHQNDDAVQEAGCAALLNLIDSNASAKNCLRDLGAFALLTPLIGRPTETESVPVNAALVLAKMMCDEDRHDALYHGCIVLFVRHDGVAQVVKYMKRFAESCEMQYPACVLLYMVAFEADSTIQRLLISEGAPEMVLQALEMYKQARHVGLMVHGILCISLMLAYNKCMANTQQFTTWKRRAIRTIVACIGANMGESPVQAHGLQALFLFFSKDTFFLEEFDKADGIRMLVTSMDTHADDVSVQQRAVDILLRISKETSALIQEKCLHMGVIDVVLRAARRFKDDSNLVTKAKQAALQMSRDHAASTAHVMRSVSSSQAKEMADLAVMDHVLEAGRHQYQDSEREKRLMKERCAGCGKNAAEAGVKRLMKCSACTIAPSYCGAACQSACWRGHKEECKGNRKHSK